MVEESARKSAGRAWCEVKGSKTAPLQWVECSYWNDLGTSASGVLAPHRHRMLWRRLCAGPVP